MLHNKRLWFSGLAVAALMVCGQASAFKSGNWNGDANNDDDGKFRDCTMLAEYNSGITLAFIITRDFDWGLVLANDKWNLELGSTQHPAFGESIECGSGCRAADVEQVGSRVDIQGRVCEHLIDQSASSSIGPEVLESSRP